MLDCAVVVHSRNVPRRLPDLGMRADAREWPSPLSDDKPLGTWLAMEGHFRGQAWSRNSYNELDDSVDVDVAGIVSMTVARDGVRAIVSPGDTSQPAIWISSAAINDDPAVRQVHGSLGAIRAAAGAKSEVLRLLHSAWTLDLAEIERIFGDTYQEGQAKSLLDAIAELRTVDADIRPTRPPAPPTRTWRCEPERGGLFRLYVDGQPGSSSSLVDRAASRDDQLAALETLTWVPPRKLDAVKRATRNELLPPPLSEPLPGDRVAHPFGGFSGWFIEPGFAAHPVARHLWPFLDADGSLLLEDGEHEDRRCTLQALQEQGIADDGSHRSGVTGLPNLYMPRIHLTNLRLVLLGEQRAEGRPPLIWGANLRHEWISEVGVVRRTYPLKKGLFKAKPRAFSDFAYARVRLPTATTIEFRLLLEQDQSTDGLVDALVTQIAGRPGRTAHPRTTAARDHDINKYATYNDGYTTTVIDGAVPVSLPHAL